MRILLLTHSFNSLAQRVYCELVELGHELSIEFDIGDAHDGVVAHAPDQFGKNFRRRVGQGHDQGPNGHPGDHFGLQHAAGRKADKNVGAGDDLAQRPRIGLLGVARLDFVHVLKPSFMD